MTLYMSFTCCAIPESQSHAFIIFKAERRKDRQRQRRRKENDLPGAVMQINKLVSGLELYMLNYFI